MNTLIKLTQSPFFWNTINGIISLLITQVSGINNEYIILIIPILNTITKNFNKKYNPYYK